eukprot:5330330-Amphidinium_carterae.1
MSRTLLLFSQDTNLLQLNLCIYLGVLVQPGLSAVAGLRRGPINKGNDGRCDSASHNRALKFDFKEFRMSEFAYFGSLRSRGSLIDLYT